MNKPTSQRGDAVTITIITILAIAIIGALGYIFWTKINDKSTEDSNTSSQTTPADETGKKDSAKTDPVNAVAQTKSSITDVLQKADYNALASTMADPVSGSLAYSDGFFTNVTPAALSGQIKDYFTAPHPTYTWTTSDFSAVTDAKLKAQAGATHHYDFNNSYVAIGTPAGSNTSDKAFIAFTINTEGKVTYAYFGYILDY